MGNVISSGNLKEESNSSAGGHLKEESCRKMGNAISHGNLRQESNSSATYTIVIKDFPEKLAKSAVGEKSTSEEFDINWSKFSIKLYIAGVNEESQGHLSLFLYNESDWMVRAKFGVSVKVMGGVGRGYLTSIIYLIVKNNNLHCCFKDEVFVGNSAFGKVYQLKDQGKNDNWGWTKCLPHSRCVPGDLLSPDETLTIHVKIYLLGENYPGGIRDQSGLKHKLDKLDMELTEIKSKQDKESTEIKSKMRKIESVVDSRLAVTV